MSRQSHWDEVYRTKQSDKVSWYQPAPTPSLEALERLGLGPDAALIDVGGGASSLVDELLMRGWRDLTVLDIAEPALKIARARLGMKASKVGWIAADLTRWTPERTWDVWHDRAVFHFLTEAADREAYIEALARALKPGGFAIIATFALNGPERCSGLSVQRYDARLLAATLGHRFELLDSWHEAHVTPAGATQSFNWAVLRRR